MGSQSERPSVAKQRIGVPQMRPPHGSRGQSLHYASVGDADLSRSQNRQMLETPRALYDGSKDAFAKLLNGVFAKAKRLKLPGMSARRVADKALGIPNERISKWRLNAEDHRVANDTAMPAFAFLRLPEWYVVETFNAILRARGMKEYEP